MSKYLEEQITRLETELATKREELENIRKSTDSPEKQLAVILFECIGIKYDDGWPYEIHNGLHDWNGNSHREWLKRANSLLRITNDVETLQKIIQIAVGR